MTQRNVEWYSVHTNGVALRQIALQDIRRSVGTLNCLALHEIFRYCGESSSLLVQKQCLQSKHSYITMIFPRVFYHISQVHSYSCNLTERENGQNSNSPIRYLCEDFRLCSRYNNVNYGIQRVYKSLFDSSVATCLLTPLTVRVISELYYK